MSEDRLVSGLNPLDQWAKPPPIAMSPDLQARPQAPQAPQPGGSPDTIQPSAAKPEVPPQFLSDLDSIIVKKEGGSPTAVSPAGAIGVHQIMPATAAPYLGVPPDKAREMLFDPAVNEKVGKRIIQDLAQRYPGDQQAVLVAYNAGPGAADRWLASGKDPSVLPQETQRYIGEYQQGKGWADEERARHDASFNSNQEMMREFLRLSAAEPAGSAKREELFNKAREASDRATESFEQLRKTPPVYKPVDIMENFGSAAVLIGILGGLFAKRPLTASLNAAGLAMQAQQQQNWDQFKVASEQWKTQAEMGLQQARLAHDQIREVMEDERMAENEKQARLRNVMSGMQLSQQQQAQWQNHYDRMSIATQAALDRADREKQRIEEHNDRMLELQRSHEEQEATRRAAMALPQQYVESLDQQWREANPGKEVPAAVHMENIKRGEAEAGKVGASGKLGPGKQFEITDPDGKVRQIYARELPDGGLLDVATQKKVEIDPKAQIKAVKESTAGGGRLATQANRQIISGREILSDLQNVVALPTETTAGVFGGRKQGPSLVDALKEDFAQKITSQDAELYNSALAGFTRELSIVVSPVYGGHWAAETFSGLGLKEGMTVLTKAYNIARIKQTAHNALEGLQASSQVDEGTKKYAKDLMTQLDQAVPWTPADVTTFKVRADPRESFKDYTARVGIGRGGNEGGSQQYKYTAVGANGVRIHSDDGVRWLKEDGTPYQ